MDGHRLATSPPPQLRVAWRSLLVFWALVAASIISGVTIAPGSDWWRPSLSHFGALGTRSAWVYDGLQVAAALALLIVALALPRACEPLVRVGRLTPGQRRGLGVAIAVLAVGLAAQALLPYNLGGPLGWPVYVTHNVAGWTEAVLPAVSMALLPWAMPVFPWRFYAWTWGCLVPLLAVWLLFVVAHVLAHGLSELIAYGVLAAWSFSFVAYLRRVVSDSLTT